MRKSEIRNPKSETNPKSQISNYEGLQADIRNLRTPKIDVWENKYPEKEYTVNLESAEFTCICPKTGLPDFATIKLKYRPDKRCVELKSFKLYIISYRGVGIFHEHAVNKILDDFVKACSPRWAHIEMVFNPRGGITTTVEAEYAKSEKLKAQSAKLKGKTKNEKNKYKKDKTNS
ncbi:MAG: NADPH-dependent 7-cyano-7-deazaguanine reductase QueF [Candidatus Omnitrophica bacterium]|nr:NADPH-dependent 7-cyano-7-deazaguanine reductase QueF [Candidatus Omnitrophota bacterium]